MAGAVFLMQFSMGVGFSTSQGPGWSYPLTILAGCLVLATFGPGSFSFDRLWGRS